MELPFRKLDEITRKLSAALPPGVQEFRADMEQQFKDILQSGLSRLDLVTQEEFEVQQAVLAKTREKLEALEQRLDAIESDIYASENE